MDAINFNFLANCTTTNNKSFLISLALALSAKCLNETKCLSHRNNKCEVFKVIQVALYDIVSSH